MNVQLLWTCCLMVWVYAQTTRADIRKEITTEQDSNVCPDGFQYFESSCYRLVSDSTTDGITARTKCQEEAAGAHLVFIESESEQNFVKNLADSARGDEDFWIGLTFTVDKDHPHWLDGTPLGTYTAWDRYGVFDESSPCVRLRESSDYLWNDRPCNNRFGYICEVERSTTDSVPITTPASKPGIAPMVDSKAATFGAGPPNMAVPNTDNYDVIRKMNEPSVFGCALYCLQNAACSSFNYKPNSCELFSKTFTNNELTKRSGYRYYRM